MFHWCVSVVCSTRSVRVRVTVWHGDVCHRTRPQSHRGGTCIGTEPVESICERTSSQIDYLPFLTHQLSLFCWPVVHQRSGPACICQIPVVRPCPARSGWIWRRATGRTSKEKCCSMRERPLHTKTLLLTFVSQMSAVIGALSTVQSGLAHCRWLTFLDRQQSHF